MTTADWTGAIGVAILLLAFMLNLIGKMKNDSMAYLVLNFMGAGIAGLASVLLNYWPFIILEACWTLVSAYGILKKMITDRALKV